VSFDVRSRVHVAATAYHTRINHDGVRVGVRASLATYRAGIVLVGCEVRAVSDEFLGFGVHRVNLPCARSSKNRSKSDFLIAHTLPNLMNGRLPRRMWP
jgi:hypothetical protein